ncbi:MAG: type II secretion system protein GspD [Candidatus Aureabacteria bacterium]|nr:type II secretion system protein GspD [Candidatus Auribacterota bacterium]
MKCFLFSAIFIIFLFNTASLFSQEIQTKPEQARREKSNDKGDMISLELKDIDVVEVIKILSRKAKFNIVIGSGVKGRITLFLNEVKLKEALFIVLEAADIAYTDKEGILTLMPEKEYESTYGREFYNHKKLVSFPIQYAVAADIATSLNKLLPKTKIIVDERTNVLLAEDSPENIEEIRKAIGEMDLEIITKNYTLKHLSAKRAEDLIKMLIGKKGVYYIDTNIKQVVIKDFPENVGKILSLLKSHDIPPKVISKSYELSYAKFDALEAKLKPILTPDIGQIVSDERTNKIIVNDLESNFEKIDNLVSEYDIKDRQVLIEAKIVQVILNDRFQLGINWQTVIEQLNNSNLGLRLMSANEIVKGQDLVGEAGFAQSINRIGKIPDDARVPADTQTTTITTNIDEKGKSTTTSNMVRTITETNQDTTTPDETTTSTILPFNQKISGPSEGGARIVATGSIGGHQFESVLNALKLVGNTKVLSSPRIIAINQKEAKLSVSSKEAYATSTVLTTATGPSTTSENIAFEEVGVMLTVTPAINRDNFITLKVKPSISSVTSYATTASGNKIPIVSKQEIESTIQVKDGTTVVLGGLHETLTDKSSNGIPFLQAIPLIGYLFKRVDNRIKNSELVMFLTPHIITGEKSFYEEQDDKIQVGKGVTEVLDDENKEPKPGFWKKLKRKLKK